MTTIGRLAIARAVVFGALQFVRPSIPTEPPPAELQTPPEVRRIVDESCYPCHSDQGRLRWFDQIVPGYWLVRRDILAARRHLNFSTLGASPDSGRKAALYECVNMIRLGAMPLPRFLMLHPDAKVTPQEIATLEAYLAPWTPVPGQSSTAVPAASPEPLPPASLTNVPPAPNGLPFDPAFEAWKPVSTTDRGDNNTLRFILGNDIAVRAAESGKITPWPDGSRFAKIAWQQESGPDGLVHPGRFVQVELMVKDAQRYQATEGWGWGRWRGLDLKPYGKDPHFAEECTGCHAPLAGNDYIYTLPITPAKAGGAEVVNNAAALPAGLPYRPLGWNAVTMYVDPVAHTMATLYGNDAAMAFVQASRAAMAGGPAVQSYPAGAVLALVTWWQRGDPHWFGARIPAAARSVEFVEISAGGRGGNYRRFGGPELAEEHPAAGDQAERTAFLVHLAPARLP